MSTPPLDNTSYVVLGLVDACEPATPYDLKRFAEIGVFNFWSVPHTRIYSECARLAEQGLLSEKRETEGRRRRIYRLTKSGREALDAWRSESHYEPLEFRDPGLIKVFFGADPAEIAPGQIEEHEAQLREFEQLRADVPDMPAGQRLALEAGIEFERLFVKFWRQAAASRGRAGATAAR